MTELLMFNKSMQHTISGLVECFTIEKDMLVRVAFAFVNCKLLFLIDDRTGETLDMTHCVVADLPTTAIFNLTLPFRAGVIENEMITQKIIKQTT